MIKPIVMTFGNPGCKPTCAHPQESGSQAAARGPAKDSRGASERQIAKRLGISRPTVHKYLEDPQACERGRRSVARASKLDAYEGNVRAWLSEDPEYKATWISLVYLHIDAGG